MFDDPDLAALDALGKELLKAAKEARVVLRDTSVKVAEIITSPELTPATLAQLLAPYAEIASSIEAFREAVERLENSPARKLLERPLGPLPAEPSRGPTNRLV